MVEYNVACWLALNGYQVRVKFSGGVRIGMKGQGQPCDFQVGLQQVYGVRGAKVKLVVQGLAKGGQLETDGRVPIGSIVVKVNRRKVAGLHGEVISKLLQYATEVSSIHL